MYAYGSFVHINLYTSIPDWPRKIETDLMDWRVHGIGANRAFEQFMNAGGGSNSRRRLWRRQLIIRIVMIVRMMVGLDLFIFQATRRGYALNVIYIHYKSKEFWWIPSIFQGFPLVSSFSWIRLEKEEPQEVGMKMGREREREIDCEESNNPRSLSLSPLVRIPMGREIKGWSP